MPTTDATDNAESRRMPLQSGNLHLEELDGEAVLCDPHTGAVHRFNATTFFVWNACDGSQTPHDVALALADHYGISADDAVKIVGCAIAQLNDRDLLLRKFPDSHDAASSGLERCGIAETPHAITGASRATSADALSAATPKADGGPSRRELLSSGVTKAVFAAPVISTFFAAGAYASGPSASAAFGVGGCKQLGYSCVANEDCCLGNPDGQCYSEVCCVKSGKDGCVKDTDCCNYPGHTCIGGTCTWTGS
jgi:hypothetical protein